MRAVVLGSRILMITAAKRCAAGSQVSACAGWARAPAARARQRATDLGVVLGIAGVQRDGLQVQGHAQVDRGHHVLQLGDDAGWVDAEVQLRGLSSGGHNVGHGCRRAAPGWGRDGARAAARAARLMRAWGAWGAGQAGVGSSAGLDRAGEGPPRAPTLGRGVEARGEQGALCPGCSRCAVVDGRRGGAEGQGCRQGGVCLSYKRRGRWQEGGIMNRSSIGPGQAAKRTRRQAGRAGVIITKYI
jgi:hypothetical protein